MVVRISKKGKCATVPDEELLANARMRVLNALYHVVQMFIQKGNGIDTIESAIIQVEGDFNDPFVTFSIMYTYFQRVLGIVLAVKAKSAKPAAVTTKTESEESFLDWCCRDAVAPHTNRTIVVPVNSDSTENSSKISDDSSEISNVSDHLLETRVSKRGWYDHFTVSKAVLRSNKTARQQHAIWIVISLCVQDFTFSHASNTVVNALNDPYVTKSSMYRWKQEILAFHKKIATKKAKAVSAAAAAASTTAAEESLENTSATTVGASPRTISVPACSDSTDYSGKSIQVSDYWVESRDQKEVTEQRVRNEWRALYEKFTDPAVIAAYEASETTQPADDELEDDMEDVRKDWLKVNSLHYHRSVFRIRR